MHPELQIAVKQAVETVNAHAGMTAVRLRFVDDDSEIDFIANSAAYRDGGFEFQAGIQRYEGLVAELAEIRTDVINPS